MQLKEAPRDDIACESAVLNHGSAIQQGAGLVLVCRETLSVVATNVQIWHDYGQPHALGDIFSEADASSIERDIRERNLIEAQFVRLRKGEFVWIQFFDANDRVGIDITYVDEAAMAKGETHHAFAHCAQSLSRQHEVVLRSENADPKVYYDALVNGLRHLSGFDRVMLYQFDPDMNGEVIAESRVTEDIPSFRGLKFPSGDIPKPARDLFFKNRVRQVIEVQAAPEPIVSTDQGHVLVDFDQTSCAFRYTAPIHLEYLTNMGVTATLTIAIIIRNRLWGLLSCHHASGRLQVSPDRLVLCHVLSDLASNHTARLIDRQRKKAASQAQCLLSELSKDAENAESSEEFSSCVASYTPRFLALLSADGLQFESETTNLILGDIPSPSTVRMLDSAVKIWQKKHHHECLATADLHRFHPNLPDAATVFGGLLQFASWDHKTRLKIYRKAKVISETWAGDPEAKARYRDYAEDVMHPRNSFAAYAQQTAGCSEVWDEWALQVGRELQSGLRNIEMSFHKKLKERQLRQSNAEIRRALVDATYLAHHDPLTGVANRRGFEKMVNQLGARARKSNKIWLCHIDVDHFKRINDCFGHLAGDTVLKTIADRLLRFSGDGGKVARIGGDEFVLLIADAFAGNDIEIACNDLLAHLNDPTIFDGIQIDVSCTVGVTAFVLGAESISKILNRSDLALYSGKQKGRGAFEFFSPDMENETKARRELESQIRRAIDAEEFVPYFQPQFDVKQKKIVGYELLSRWHHPKWGILQPLSFLDTAKNMGALTEIDRNMLLKATKLQNAWAQKTGEMTTISINVSVERLYSNELISDLTALGDHAHNITLELLESIDLDGQNASLNAKLQQLRKIGVGIEIDDFGSGRTSILAVLAVQPDRLKIDKRLIDPISMDTSARNVVKAVIDIGTQLGISAVAEGVETAEQYEILSELNCERIQGHFLGKACSASETERLVFGSA